MQSSGDFPVVISFFTWNTFILKIKAKIAAGKKKVVKIFLLLWNECISLPESSLCNLYLFLSYMLVFEPNSFFLTEAFLLMWSFNIYKNTETRDWNIHYSSGMVNIAKPHLPLKNYNASLPITWIIHYRMQVTLDHVKADSLTYIEVCTSLTFRLKSKSLFLL